MCVLTVTYNSADDMAGLLRSVQSATRGLRVEVLVVDNSSTDLTADVVKQFSQVRWLSTGSNLGYAGAINRGRRGRAADGPLVVLNPDLLLRPDALRQMVAAVDDPLVGIVVPRVLDEEGDLYRSLRREPTLLRALGDALFGHHWPQRPSWLSETVWEDGAYEHAQDVDWATGAAMLVARDCDLAVGDWDEQRFFMYSEETDYARRARDLGFAVRYVPEAVVLHRGGGSGASPSLAALLTVNRVRYFEKHHGRAAALAFRAVACLDAALRCSRPEQRAALRRLLHRASWRTLPGGRA